MSGVLIRIVTSADVIVCMPSIVAAVLAHNGLIRMLSAYPKHYSSVGVHNRDEVGCQNPAGAAAGH